MLISTYASSFTGLGGLDIGVEAVTKAKPLFFAEPDPYCSAVLAKHWPGVPNYGAIQNVDKEAQSPDLFVAGVPCTDASSAGKRKGLRAKEDYHGVDPRELRTGLWHHVEHVLGVLRPRFFFLENVEGLLVRGLDVILGDLATLGYDAQWATLRAADVGAPHLRRCVFLLAIQGGLSDAERLELRQLGERYRKQRGGHGDVRDADEERRGEWPGIPTRQPDLAGPGEDVADGVHDGLKGLSSRHDDDRRDASGHEPHGRDALVWPGWPPAIGDAEGWTRYDGARPGVRRSAYGLPRGLDARRRRARLARLGNAVVSLQAALALAELMIRAAQT